MAPDEKPYRVYRGGRVKGKVPAPSVRARQAKAARERGREPRGSKAPTAPKRRALLRRLPRRRIVLLGLVVLLALLVAWATASFFAVRGGAKAANERLAPEARAALAPGDGLLLSNETTILLLGTDTSPFGGRSGNRHADSIMLVRTDPSRHRIAYLSIPRDLLVPVPGLGTMKINASFQAGGAPLAIRTVREFTSIPIEHVVVIDFANFEDLIDAEGGITIDVPRPIVSKFDCPYPTEQRCRQWDGWRFRKGKQHMDGRRALIYARVRKNELREEDDFARSSRQQAVIQAATGKLTSAWTAVKLPFIGDSLLEPLATDLTAAQLIQLGWVKFRASGGSTLYCRLGGDSGTFGNQSAIIPSEDNRNVLAMWRGKSAPQPPTTTHGPGCAKGRPLR
jgi:LCP family protein required for cell wall assembly